MAHVVDEALTTLSSPCINLRARCLLQYDANSIDVFEYSSSLAKPIPCAFIPFFWPLLPLQALLRPQSTVL